MKQINLILFAIIILGLILRVSWINNSPPSLYGDELTIALDVNSLLHTGQDQLGNFFPLTFEMGAGRPAGYVYGSIPFMAIFGPSVLGVRALSILSGLGIIILLFFLCKKLFSEKVGLAAAFIAAVSPWDISLSRAGFEAHFALFLVLLGVYLFIKAKEMPMLYPFSAISFGLTLHTYPTYKVSLLLFLPMLVWYQISRFASVGRKYFVGGIVVFLILGLTALSQTFIGGSEERFSDINIFSRQSLKSEIEQKINLERNLTSLPESLAKHFHNKPIEYSKVFIENYLQNFSMDFLVLHGDRNPRHNMATMGQFFFAEILLVLIGILTLLQQNRKLFLFLIGWILIAPIPTALVDLPHALRSSFMLPPIIFFSALGLVTVWNMRSKLTITLVMVLFIVQFAFFTQKLYFLAPLEYSNFWSYSAKIASEIALQNRSKYDYIFISDKIDSIEFAYPIYNRIDPKDVINQNQKRVDIGDLQFKKFDNVYIGQLPEADIEKFAESRGGSVLLIGPLDFKTHLSSFETVFDEQNREILSLKKIP